MTYPTDIPERHLMPCGKTVTGRIWANEHRKNCPECNADREEWGENS